MSRVEDYLNDWVAIFCWKQTEAKGYFSRAFKVGVPSVIAGVTV